MCLVANSCLFCKSSDSNHLLSKEFALAHSCFNDSVKALNLISLASVSAMDLHNLFIPPSFNSSIASQASLGSQKYVFTVGSFINIFLNSFSLSSFSFLSCISLLFLVSIHVKPLVPGFLTKNILLNGNSLLLLFDQ